MKIIVGLGNPGVEYMGTRHNAGVMLVDNLSTQCSEKSAQGWRKFYSALVWKSKEFILVKSKEVFMNESGKLLQGLPEGELYVAHDDLDIKLGEFKIQKGVGPKLHYGVQSIEQRLGRKDFWRIRIGIDNRTTPVEGEIYVLQKFTSQEKDVLEKSLDAIIKAVNAGQEPDRQK